MEDEKFYSKYLFFNWSGRSFSIAIEQLNVIPFEDHKKIDSTPLYIDVFDGGWVDAMTPYKNWYGNLFKKEKESRL